MTAVESALSAINVDRLEQSLVDLLQIPSVVGTQAEVDIAKWLSSQWTSEGMTVTEVPIDLDAIRSHPEYPGEEVERSAALSVVASHTYGDGPHIMLLGHTDVVPTGDLAQWNAEPFTAVITEREGQRVIVARGACDMKAGMAAAWEAVRACHESGALKRGTITLASVCAEEDGGLGTFALIQAGIRADMCIIPEPTSLNVIPSNAGALTFTLTVKGKSIHASRKHEGISAFDKFIPIYDALNKLEIDRNALPDELFDRWTFPFAISIGTIHAGDWSSSVPGELVAEGRIGVRPDESIEDAKRALEELLTQMCNADEWLREHPVRVEWTGGMFAPGHTPIDTDVVQAVAKAHRDCHGNEAEIYGAPYGSDLRLWSRVAVPTIQYGPGDVTYAHTANEFVDLEETLDATKTFVQLLVNELG